MSVESFLDAVKILYDNKKYEELRGVIFDRPN